MTYQLIKDILAKGEANTNVTVKGWVRTSRGSKNVSFVAMNDGSTIQNLQVVIDNPKFDEETLKRIHTGTSLQIEGSLVESPGQQDVELQAHNITVLGDCNPDAYPIQPKKHSLEFLRENAHLRFRTTTFSAIFRVRNAVSFAIHKYFNEKGFYYIHTPIITASDAEGAGEMFRVTTLDAKNPPLGEKGEVDFKEDFFGKETNLTVSGQLEGELAATALGKIYTYGPTFRAENSNTTRHLAEFWMIEPEVAFYDLKDTMDLAEDFTKYIINYVLENCMEDLTFLSNRQKQEEKGMKEADKSMELIEKLRFVVDNEFVRISYTEAFEILRNSNPNKKKRFQYPVNEWGVDLQSEHERYLVEKKFEKPVILYDYPKDIKAFYMRQNEDGKTVAAMDVLFPQIGEVIGGSQREERLAYLEQRMDEMNIPKEEMDWYLDTRRYGTVVHSGFGLGFERMVLFVTGMGNIRDVIPFPRTPKHARF